MNLRTGRRAMVLLMVVAMLGTLAIAAPSAPAQTSVVTQEDCDAGRITRNGRQLSKSECEALIGQRVNLAQTGFEAWILGLGGLALMAAGAVVVLRRRGPARQIA
jgi:LPXTG-motif cell wall-anchored protein